MKRSDKPTNPDKTIALKLRRILAFPLYIIAVIMTVFGDFLAIVAEKIAGDS